MPRAAFARKLDADPRIGDFRVLASHQESLHSHDAVSVPDTRRDVRCRQSGPAPVCQPVPRWLSGPKRDEAIWRGGSPRYFLARPLRLTIFARVQFCAMNQGAHISLEKTIMTKQFLFLASAMICPCCLRYRRRAAIHISGRGACTARYHAGPCGQCRQPVRKQHPDHHHGRRQHPPGPKRPAPPWG